MRDPAPVRSLLIAEAANPEWVSVPLVGWSHAEALSRVCDAHLVTQIRNRPAIERWGWREGKEFTAIDSEAIARNAYRVAGKLRGGKGKGWTLVTAMATPSYLYFEQLFWARFRTELEAGKWDVVHRITPLSPTVPSFLGPRLARLGVPYVVGPLNGGVPWPREFDGARRAEKEWLSYVRGAYRLMPGYRSLRKTATAMIAGSADTFDQMPSWTRDRLLYVPENAIDISRFQLADPDAPPRSDASAPLRVGFVGRLVPYKGLDMLLEAAEELVRAGRVQIVVIGDGPERERNERFVEERGLESGVEFAGWLEHTEVAEKLRSCDVFGFPSIREFGGGVVLEAMALGVVPLVVGYGGPKELVTPEVGIAVPIGERRSIVGSFRDALEQCVEDRERVHAMRRRAIQRVARWFTWERKAEQSLAIYDWVLGRGPRPDWGMPLAESEHSEPSRG